MAHTDDAVRQRVLRALRNAGLADNAAMPRAGRFGVRPLHGGIGARSYLAAVEGQAFVVRVAREDRPGALELAAEAEITQEAAALGIAPRVIATDAATGALITEHLAGARPMTAEALRTRENIARAARLLRRLHTLRRERRRYDPERFAEQYIAAAAPLGPADLRRAAELRELARAYRTRYPSHVLCHNDLFAPNVLDDGELKLVDFEYAVTAAPVLDIAGLAALNDFDDDERWRLAEAYYAGAPVPFTAAELAKVARLVRLIAYFWALSSAAAAGGRGPYGALAEHTATALDKNERS